MSVEIFNSSADWHDKGYYLRHPPLMIASYDPAGDGNDYDALVLTAREEFQKGEPHDPDFAVEIMFRVLMAYRIPPDFEVPDKIAQLLRLHRTLNMWRDAGRAHGHIFTVETNGVGYGVASTLKSKIGGHVIPYHTVATISHNEPFVEKKVAMPRLAALDLVRLLLETHHLRAAKDAPGRELLMAELQSFVWRRANRPEALAGQHDDLLMAMTGGIWIGSKVVPPILKAKRYRKQSRVH